MLKLNQKGALDPIVIILLVLVLAMGSYIGYTILNKDEPSENTQVTQQDTQTEEQQPTSDEDTVNDLFTIDLLEGWSLKEVKGEIGQTTADVDGRWYVYENGTHMIEVQVEPGGGRGVMSDISWRYKVSESGNSFAIDTPSKELCDTTSNPDYCDAGNGVLNVFVKQDDEQTKETTDGYRYNFYYSNSASEAVSDALLDDFETIVESIKLSN